MPRKIRIMFCKRKNWSICLRWVINPTNIGLRKPAVLLAAFTIPMTTDAFRGAISNTLTWKPAYTAPAAAPATHIQQITASGFSKYPAIKMNRPAVSSPARKRKRKSAGITRFEKLTLRITSCNVQRYRNMKILFIAEWSTNAQSEYRVISLAFQTLGWCIMYHVMRPVGDVSEWSRALVWWPRNPRFVLGCPKCDVILDHTMPLKIAFCV